MKNLLIILALLANLFIACEDDKEEIPMLEISSSELTTLSQPFLHEADERTVDIVTNQEVVKVTSSENWCKAMVLEDNGSFHLRVSVFPNTGFEERTAKITVFAKGLPEISIPILQWADQPSLTVANGGDINIVDGDLEFSVEITSNIDFTLTLPDWVSDKDYNIPIVGHKKYNFVASFVNPGTRTGEIKIEAPGYESLNKTIKIIQLQNTLHPSLATFSPTSGEKTAVVTLHGENFGTLAEIVKVYFNKERAEIESITNTEIRVVVPRAPGEACDISVVVGEDSVIYTNKFNYVKSWGLSTVTGNGNATFKPGTLNEGQIKARYLAVDDNNNIFATHRENTAELFFARINEAENKIESLSGNTALDKSKWTPNTPCIGPNGIVYVANDVNNGTSYYSLDPQNGWTPVAHTVTYSTAPASGYLYTLAYNKQDGCLYGIMGSTKGQLIKIDPKTNQGSIVFEWNLHPYWYAITFHPTDPNMIYTMANTANPGYGVWRKDASDLSSSFIRLNSSGQTSAATATQVKDESLISAAFARCYQMVFGKDGLLYVSDEVNHVIRKIDLTKQTVETVVGISGSNGYVDGKKSVAKLNKPRGLAWNKDGTALYISDLDNSRIRKWSFD